MFEIWYFAEALPSLWEMNRIIYLVIGHYWVLLEENIFVVPNSISNLNIEICGSCFLLLVEEMIKPLANVRDGQA